MNTANWRDCRTYSDIVQMSHAIAKGELVLPEGDAAAFERRVEDLFQATYSRPITPPPKPRRRASAAPTPAAPPSTAQLAKYFASEVGLPGLADELEGVIRGCERHAARLLKDSRGMAYFRTAKQPVLYLREALRRAGALSKAG